METGKLMTALKQMDWDLFLKQKEWLYSQQCYIEKWYGVEAAALPEGIINMMDQIQNAYEDVFGGIIFD